MEALLFPCEESYYTAIMSPQEGSYEFEFIMSLSEARQRLYLGGRATTSTLPICIEASFCLYVEESYYFNTIFLCGGVIVPLRGEGLLFVIAELYIYRLDRSEVNGLVIEGLFRWIFGVISLLTLVLSYSLFPMVIYT